MHYFDCAATSKPFPEAMEAYARVCESFYGNPSSHHAFGYSALRELEQAKKDILNAFGLASTHDVIFTSGATESNNLALKGVAKRYANRGKRILSSSVEHPSVSEPGKALEKEGFSFEPLPVNGEGIVEPKTLEEALDKDVCLVSLMGVNNETGSIFPLEEYRQILRNYPKVLFHSDLTQAVGKVEFPYSLLDCFSFSGHKIGGLKGTGALIYKKTLQFVPLLDGGGQQNGYRSGTIDVAGAVSLAAALKITMSDQKENERKERLLRDRLREELSSIDEILFHSPKSASPYILNFSLLRHKASVIVEALSNEGYYVSSVSACSSKGEPVSEVLLAMGVPVRQASNSIRVSLPPSATLEEVDGFVTTLKKILSQVRPL